MILTLLLALLVLCALCLLSVARAARRVFPPQRHPSRPSRRAQLWRGWVVA